MGSRIFLDVLRHELIHVAQSCYSGAKNDYPKRIGLPLEFSKEINLNLSHKLYKKKFQEEYLWKEKHLLIQKLMGQLLNSLKDFVFKFLYSYFNIHKDSLLEIHSQKIN